MATIKADFGEGGQQLTSKGGTKTPTLATALREAADDFETFRAQFNSLLAKLDADAGITDVDYASTLEIASATVKTKKG